MADHAPSPSFLLSDVPHTGPFSPEYPPSPLCRLYPPAPMEIFDPATHLRHLPPAQNDSSNPPSPLARAVRANPGLTLIPRPEDCTALWDSYHMLDNIRRHCLRVAELAWALALAARDKGFAVNPDAIRAAGLLHDLGKTHSIAHGGSHAQLGAAWVMRETRNASIAQAVLFHVHWPWEENLDDDGLFTVFAVVYADKRVKHDSFVSLDERFGDLQSRYGVNEYLRSRIQLSLEQGKRIEEALSRRLEVNLHEYIADNGRLVQRT